MNAMIEASGLTKSFEGRTAVDGIDLHIRAGEIYGLVGSDGAGKTTTIRMLVGALKPDSGSASIAGYDVDRQTEQARAQIGYLSQRFSLYEDLTVLENIRFFAEVRGLSSGEWLPLCLEILDFVGLGSFKDRRAGQLSGGMKQKLGLATALVAKPKVLLLDEPTTGVDPVTRQDFWHLLISLVAATRQSDMEGIDQRAVQVAVLISTPYMDEAARCSRVGFMRQGKLIAEGSPSQLRSALTGRILEIRGSPVGLVRQVAESDPAVEAVRAFGDRLHLRLAANETTRAIPRLRQGIEEQGGRVEYLREIPPLLEDVFIALSERDYE